MIKLKFGILLAMLAVTTTAFAGYSPANVQAALKKMYPDAKNIAWSQDDGYYCADFMMNGLEKNVWFNTQAQWVMIQTELISTDRLTPPVYNAFAASNYLCLGSPGCNLRRVSEMGADHRHQSGTAERRH